MVAPVRHIVERLEKTTNDSWPEKRVHHYTSPESAISAGQLVDQAFKEYEKAERVREFRAPGQLPSPREHHAHG